MLQQPQNPEAAEVSQKLLSEKNLVYLALKNCSFVAKDVLAEILQELSKVVTPKDKTFGSVGHQGSYVDKSDIRQIIRGEYQHLMWELAYPSLPLHPIRTSNVIALLFSQGEFALVWAMLFAVIVAEKVILTISACVLNRIQVSHVATVADKTVFDSGVKVIRTGTRARKAE